LQIAVGIAATVASGDAGKRPVPDQGGQFDRRRGNRLDHLADRRARWRQRRGPIQM
jgi:hypothetical protein